MANDDKLRMLREAGRGGMGEVYEAWDPVIARKLALKRLRADRSDLEPAFVEEARVAGRLEHPHIVPVHGLGYQDGTPYFTMTWVDGDTLEDRLRNDFGTYRALMEHLEILVKVVDAVAYAHERGVIHRDLKPENIMVGRHGRVYVTDWGIARVWDPQRFSQTTDEQVRGVDAPDGTRLGTAEYMAPEQARGENSQLGPACDIWAVGVLLYQCLAGRTPFRGRDADETISRILAGEYPAASTIVGSSLAPTELEGIVAKALRYDPADRYPSLELLEADLHDFLRGTYEMPRRAYNAGDVIVFQGEVGQEAYILETGRCDVWAETGPGKPERVASIEEGEFFGEAALVEDTERSASVVAATDCVVSVVGREVLEREKGRMQPWMASFVATLVERFRNTNRQLHEQRARHEREILLQALLWVRAFGEEHEGTLRGSWRMCSDHLIDFSGLKRGPLRAALEAFEVVEIDGRHDIIEIVDGIDQMQAITDHGTVDT